MSSFKDTALCIINLSKNTHHFPRSDCPFNHRLFSMWIVTSEKRAGIIIGFSLYISF